MPCAQLRLPQAGLSPELEFGNPVGRLVETDDPLELEPGENYITLEIKTGNAAFEDNGLGYECARILREASAKLRDGEVGFKLRDSNGNTVGQVEEVTGEFSKEAASSETKVALLVGSLSGGFIVQSILAESESEDAVVRLLADGKLAEAVEITDPGQAADRKAAEFEADPHGHVVVIFGSLSSGVEAYGPFSDSGTAVEFADAYRETWDTQYEVFEIGGGPEHTVDVGYSPM